MIRTDLTLLDDLEGENLLDYAEEVFEEVLEADLIEKAPTEDKIILSRQGLTPGEIQDIIHEAMSELPEGLESYFGAIFDAMYEAISEAVNQARG